MANSPHDAAAGSHQNPVKFIRDHHPLRWLIVLAAFVIGCKVYYKAVPVEPTTTTLENLRYREHKYFVLHIDKGDFYLEDVVVDVRRTHISGTPQPLPADHQFYKNTKPAGKPTGYTAAKGDPTTEVHLYAGNYDVVDGKQIFIPIGNIDRIDVYNVDEKANRRARTLRTVSISVGFLLFIVAAVAAPLSDMSFGGFSMYCPEIYASDGIEYQLVGELYAGAMYAPMEREDYLLLPELNAKGGEYSLRIVNREEESDHTNLAELTLVEHPVDTKVAFDRAGQLHTLTDLNAPGKAIASTGQDYTAAIIAADSAYAMFDENPKADKSMSSLSLTFPKPADAKEGKLLIRGRSSEWQEYIYEKFTEQFGTAYHAYAEQQAARPHATHYQWLQEQGLSLSVYVETKDGWVLQDWVPPTGAMADRDIIVPVDLTNVNTDVVNVRLSCAFMTWMVDYAAMDFSPNRQARIITIPPFTATDDKGRDVTAQITAVDDRYLIQPDQGNQVNVTYLAIPMRADKAYTAFLHSQGYYLLTRDYTNKPNTGYTKTFEKPAAFAKFSKERYADLIEQYSQMTGQDANVK